MEEMSLCEDVTHNPEDGELDRTMQIENQFNTQDEYVVLPSNNTPLTLQGSSGTPIPALPLQCHVSTRYSGDTTPVPHFHPLFRTAATLIQKYIRAYLVLHDYLKLYAVYDQHNRVVQEIVYTERSYVNSLKELIEVIIDPSLSEAVLSPQQVENIFGPLKDIFKINTSLLTQLEQLVETQGLWAASIGQTFNDVVPSLCIYSSYVNNYDTAMCAMGYLRKNKSLNAFLQAAITHSHLKHKNIEDYLIMPVQRIPRYTLLLRELKKCTPEDHTDYKELKTAVDKVSWVGDEINNKKKELESLTKISKIEHRIQFQGIPPKPIKRLDCLLLRDEYVTVALSLWRGGEPLECLVLLFTDALWLLRPSVEILSERNFIFMFSWELQEVPKVKMALGDVSGSGGERLPTVRLQHEKAGLLEMVFGDIKDQLMWYETLRHLTEPVASLRVCSKPLAKPLKTKVAPTDTRNTKSPLKLISPLKSPGKSKSLKISGKFRTTPPLESNSEESEESTPESWKRYVRSKSMEGGRGRVMRRAMSHTKKDKEKLQQDSAENGEERKISEVAIEEETIEGTSIEDISITRSLLEESSESEKLQSQAEFPELYHSDPLNINSSFSKRKLRERSKSVGTRGMSRVSSVAGRVEKTAKTILYQYQSRKIRTTSSVPEIPAAIGGFKKNRKSSLGGFVGESLEIPKTQSQPKIPRNTTENGGENGKNPEIIIPLENHTTKVQYHAKRRNRSYTYQGKEPEHQLLEENPEPGTTNPSPLGLNLRVTTKNDLTTLKSHVEDESPMASPVVSERHSCGELPEGLTERRNLLRSRGLSRELKRTKRVSTNLKSQMIVKKEGLEESNSKHVH